MGKYGDLIFVAKDGKELQIKRDEVESILRFVLALVDCLEWRGDQVILEGAKRLAYVHAHKLIKFHTIRLREFPSEYWYRIRIWLNDHNENQETFSIDVGGILCEVRELGSPDDKDLVEYEISVHLRNKQLRHHPVVYLSPSQIQQKGQLRLRRSDFMTIE